MDVAKRIIDQRINKILEDNPAIFSDGDMERNRSRAFLLLGVSAYLDIDMAEAVQYLTDGGGKGLIWQSISAMSFLISIIPGFSGI